MEANSRDGVNINRLHGRKWTDFGYINSAEEANGSTGYATLYTKGAWRFIDHFFFEIDQTSVLGVMMQGPKGKILCVFIIFLFCLNTNWLNRLIIFLTHNLFNQSGADWKV